jgi:hypothetical protein
VVPEAKSFLGVVVGKARARTRRENDCAYPPRVVQRSGGGGPRVSAVEGACSDEASREADAPSTALLRRAVPLPRFAGQDEKGRESRREKHLLFCPA